MPEFDISTLYEDPDISWESQSKLDWYHSVSQAMESLCNQQIQDIIWYSIK